MDKIKMVVFGAFTLIAIPFILGILVRVLIFWFMIGFNIVERITS